jgi:hypothetical protein
MQDNRVTWQTIDACIAVAFCIARGVGLAVSVPVVAEDDRLDLSLFLGGGATSGSGN